MNRRTKALAIPKKVKDAVWERDGHRCVLCGSPYAAPEAHFIARSQGGLGIEQNILTLCRDCHRRYDSTTERATLRETLGEYLKACYPGWEEYTLIYRKGE